MRLLKKRSVKIPAAIVLFASLATLAYPIYTQFFTEQARSLRSANITYYEPTYLPEGVTIKNHQLFVSSYAAGGDPFGRNVTNYSIVLSFRDVDNVYSIDQFPISVYENSDDFMSTDVNNYDAESEHPTCKMVQGKMRYRLCHWEDYDGLYSVYEMKFVKENTAIRVNLNSPDTRTLRDSEISMFIDSFKPGNPNDLTIVKTFGGA